MTREFTIRHTANLRNGNTAYDTPQSKGSYNLNQETEGAYVPGQITVPTTGVDIDLTELGTPGYWEGYNLDDTNTVELCIHDGSIAHPFQELPPGGKLMSGYFPRSLGEERTVPGTGTSAVVNTLMAIANVASCKIVLNIFER